MSSFVQGRNRKVWEVLDETKVEELVPGACELNGKVDFYLSNKSELIVHNGPTYLATRLSGYRVQSKHVTPRSLISWKFSTVIDWKQGNNPALITCLISSRRLSDLFQTFRPTHGVAGDV